MINLNNYYKILFLLILSSCTVTSIDTIDDIKKEEVTTQDFFKKSDVIISPLDDYNIELSVLEKFVTDTRIEGNNIHHSNLPIPSVLRLSDPNNLDNSIIVRNIKLDTENRLSLSQEIIYKISLDTKVYLEYLKDESIILRNVVDSKEESKIKMDDTEISFEQLDQDQTEISEKLDYEKIKTLDIKNSKKQNTILVEIYKDINLKLDFLIKNGYLNAKKTP